MKESIPQNNFLHTHEYEKASNAYLMAVVSVIAGLPLPIINTIASVGYYLGQRKTSYFVRWHCTQAIIAQAIMIPFNSIAFAWTIRIIIQNSHIEGSYPHGRFRLEEGLFSSANIFYFTYMLFVAIFNIVEFIGVIITASQVRKGKNVRWFLVANITDSLVSKENRDPYKI